MLEKYIELRSRKSSLLNQYAKADKEEKKAIKKEYEKIDGQMLKIKKSLPKQIWKQL